MTPQQATLLRADSANADTADGEEQGAASRIDAACALLNSDSPDLVAFCRSLYTGASPEDVARYAPESLSALARLVFDRCRVRKAGEMLVELFDLRVSENDHTLNETVLLAVNDDMPFLFDSLMGELAVQNLRAHALFHPVLQVKRDADGNRGTGSGALRESIILAVLESALDETRRRELAEGARKVFARVTLAVRDWRRMLERLADTVAELKRNPPPIPAEDLNESVAFLEWLGENHFTFLGCRDYVFYGGEGGKLEPVGESSLGILSDTAARVIGRGSEPTGLSPELRDFLTRPEPLIITKAGERSLVHRRIFMDYVGVKLFDDRGQLRGERRFIGLFTSSAYTMRPVEVPLLRLKVAHVLARAGFPPQSHDGKGLAHILDTFPRVELLQASEDEIFATAMGVLRLGERPKLRVFLRFDRFDRFVSALVYVPRDRYDAAARDKIHAILARALNGRMSAAAPVIDETQLVRIHYIVGRNPGPRPAVDPRQLETEINAAIRTWGDGFAQSLIREFGESQGLRLLRRHAGAFPPRYRDVFAPDEAVRDLVELDDLTRRGQSVRARAYRMAADGRSALRMKLYAVGRMLPLSATLPIFENLGFRAIAEDSYAVTLVPETQASVLDFQLERADGGAIELDETKSRIEDAFHALMAGAAENDGFNRLIVLAGLNWRDVTILRASAKFLRQAGLAFSQDYVEQALARNPDIAALLVSLFHRLHDPKREGREAAVEKLRARIDSALNDVPSLDDDRIIRRLRNVVECMLRTNFFQQQPDGRHPDYLCFKLDSHRLDELPAPRPLYEIFVYSPAVEGVHLRFGKVARGGIRWSDRREDFRTEILGLVKAQQVKNAVIVPVGAKGGFFPKQLPLNAPREDVQARGVAAYRMFIHALLDLTDNLGPDGAVIPPPDILRHDGDDPYFVVAADKGTATFSDIANEIADSRGYWLGDAFASGGSHGYAH